MTITSNVPAANVTPLGRGQRHVEAVPSFVGDRNEARLTRRDLYGIVWWQWSQSRKADGGRHRIASTKTGEVRDIVKNAEHDAVAVLDIRTVHDFDGVHFKSGHCGFLGGFVWNDGDAGGLGGRSGSAINERSGTGAKPCGVRSLAGDGDEGVAVG